MVLEGRLELPRIAPLAPQASASAIPPPEHKSKLHKLDHAFYYNSLFLFVKSSFAIFRKFYFCRIRRYHIFISCPVYEADAARYSLPGNTVAISICLWKRSFFRRRHCRKSALFWGRFQKKSKILSFYACIFKKRWHITSHQASIAQW